MIETLWRLFVIIISLDDNPCSHSKGFISCRIKCTHKLRYICYSENILNIIIGVQFNVLIKVDIWKNNSTKGVTSLYVTWTWIFMQTKIWTANSCKFIHSRIPLKKWIISLVYMTWICYVMSYYIHSVNSLS